MSSKRVVFVLLAGLIGGIAVGAIGLIAGAWYGGNYATALAFNGLRGYEAVGQIGTILGFISGGVLCSYVAARLTRPSSQPKKSKEDKKGTASNENETAYISDPS